MKKFNLIQAAMLLVCLFSSFMVDAVGAIEDSQVLGASVIDSADDRTVVDGTISQTTGSIAYDEYAFNAPGLYTLQNNAGIGSANNNGAFIAAYVGNNGGSSGAGSMTSFQGLNAAVYNYSRGRTEGRHVRHQSGDIGFASRTFDAPGLYTISNNTGLGNADNNATGLVIHTDAAGFLPGVQQGN